MATVLTTRPESAPSDRSSADHVWIVIPAYNESARLDKTLRSVGGEYANVVVVDDGSIDDTSVIARRHGVWLARHAINCGQGAALQTGIELALAKGAEIIVTFDADGQHRAEDIQQLCEPIESGDADVVLGSRFLGEAVNMPFRRRLILQLGVLFTRLISWVAVTDTHNGLRAFSRGAARAIRIQENGMAHASEILHQIRARRLRYCERPVTIEYTPATLAKGQSNWNALKIAGQFVLGRFVR